MVNLTKEKIEKVQSEEIPKWREKKTRWMKIKGFVKKNKFLTVATICLIVAMVANIVLIYSFFRILATF